MNGGTLEIVPRGDPKVRVRETPVYSVTRDSYEESKKHTELDYLNQHVHRDSV